MAIRVVIDRMLLVWKASADRWFVVYQSGDERQELGPLPAGFRPSEESYRAAGRTVLALLNEEVQQ